MRFRSRFFFCFVLFCFFGLFVTNFSCILCLKRLKYKTFKKIVLMCHFIYEYRREITFLWDRFWQCRSPVGRLWTPKTQTQVLMSVLPKGWCLTLGIRFSCWEQHVSGMVVWCWVMPKWNLSLCSKLRTLNQLLQPVIKMCTVGVYRECLCLEPWGLVSSE